MSFTDKGIYQGMSRVVFNRTVGGLRPVKISEFRLDDFGPANILLHSEMRLLIYLYYQTPTPGTPTPGTPTYSIASTQRKLALVD